MLSILYCTLRTAGEIVENGEIREMNNGILQNCAESTNIIKMKLYNFSTRMILFIPVIQISLYNICNDTHSDEIKVCMYTYYSNKNCSK